MSKRVKVRRGFISPPAKEEPPETPKALTQSAFADAYVPSAFAEAVASLQRTTTIGMDFASGPDMTATRMAEIRNVIDRDINSVLARNVTTGRSSSLMPNVTEGLHPADASDRSMRVYAERYQRTIAPSAPEVFSIYVDSDVRSRAHRICAQLNLEGGVRVRVQTSLPYEAAADRGGAASRIVQDLTQALHEELEHRLRQALAESSDIQRVLSR